MENNSKEAAATKLYNHNRKNGFYDVHWYDFDTIAARRIPADSDFWRLTRSEVLAIYDTVNAKMEARLS